MLVVNPQVLLLIAVPQVDASKAGSGGYVCPDWHWLNIANPANPRILHRAQPIQIALLPIKSKASGSPFVVPPESLGSRHW